MLAMNGLNCCACQQIHGLSTYSADNIKKAMLDFCVKIFHEVALDTSDYRYHYNCDKFVKKIHTYYLFNGCISYRKGSRAAKNPDQYPVGYVEAFKKLIEDNNLGEVVTSTPDWNRRNEPSHKIMNCMWHPHPIRLREWYKANRDKKLKGKVLVGTI